MISQNNPPQPPRLPQMDGIVALDKPAGPSSSQCLGPFKRQGQKKIGHAGTLDPMARGVLIVLLGQATKLSTWLLNSGRKTYSGMIRLGVETSTWDMEGEIVAESDWTRIDPETVNAAVMDWLNLTEQEVPAYSAAKHNGQPLYKMARKGHDTPVKVKNIQIFEAAALNISLPFVRFRVSCASGVYIRSLAHSLGRRLGCGAALSELTREYSQPFKLEEATPLEEIRAGLQRAHVLPMTRALPDWPEVPISLAEAAGVRNGRPVPAADDAAGYAFLCLRGAPVAVGRALDSPSGRFWVIERGLWNQ